ncbi:MAG: BolA family protein [Neisseria sp.]|nr:BolA family protein [Neisseria sp.]
MEGLIAAALAGLQPEVFEFEDESHLHAGHAGNRGGGHYRILVVSPAFDGVSRVMRQRMVKDALADLFADGRIHALSIRSQTPDEYFH